MVNPGRKFNALCVLTGLNCRRLDGQPLKEQWNFKLIVANDTIVERWAKSIATISVVRAASQDAH